MSRFTQVAEEEFMDLSTVTYYYFDDGFLYLVDDSGDSVMVQKKYTKLVLLKLEDK